MHIQDHIDIDSSCAVMYSIWRMLSFVYIFTKSGLKNQNGKKLFGSPFNVDMVNRNHTVW